MSATMPETYAGVWGESHTSYWLTTFDVLEWLRKARGSIDRSIATIEGQER